MKDQVDGIQKRKIISHTFNPIFHKTFHMDCQFVVWLEAY
uniref:C2 domain-containing protein n=1 Tax=Rhizophora mucronata TaxID=61149 RepID=A0A2P2MGZ1_RHIMU